MELVRPGTYIDFMRHRGGVVGMSFVLVVLSVASIFYPGPNYGIDFAGGTELQLKFKGNARPDQIRAALEDSGYKRPDVVSVEGARNEYIIRVQEVSSLPESQVRKMRQAVKQRLPAGTLKEFRTSPGGDKVTLRLANPTDDETIQAALESTGVTVTGVHALGGSEDQRYEAQLQGISQELVEKLRAKLGSAGPEMPRRVEWVGPKAGRQLRDAAIKSLLWAVAFIMVYVAFRFDLRFAPGGVLAMAHDVLITLGIYVLVQKEVNLTTIAALLTILGYSINDTIVVYDRIRENMTRHRDLPLKELINISTSQMLSRTIVTSGTTLISVSAFFVWGTPVIRDISFALFIGILIGTYSSIYVAAPVTEWMDRRFFRKSASAA